MKRREIDIFGILVGLVIGCVIGFFLSKKINLEIPNLGNDPVVAQVGNVYLLQVEKTSSPLAAEDLIKSLKNKSLYAVAVLDGNNYYIYGGIANSEAELLNLKEKFLEKGYSAIIKKEYILDKPNFVIDDQTKYDFYTECVANLLKSLKGEKLEISSNTRSNPANLELFSSILTMNTIENETLLKEVRLSIYEMIIESLN